MKLTHVTISIDIAHAISAYVGSRPFDEVQGVLTAFRNEVNASLEAQEQAAAQPPAETPEPPQGAPAVN